MKKKTEGKESKRVKFLFHGCSNDYQDSKYGFHKRVCNITKKEHGEDIVYRCTVCGENI